MVQIINFLASEEARRLATTLRRELNPLIQDYRDKLLAQRTSLAQVFYFPSTMTSLLLEGTNEERKRLYETARDYNQRQKDRGDILLAHGNARGGAGSLCQIFIDGELKHYLHHENYGMLGNNNFAFGGHWDKGWGLFVATNDTIRKRREKADVSDNVFTIPLDLLNAVVLPAQVVRNFINLFPNYSVLIKSYEQYTEELLQE